MFFSKNVVFFIALIGATGQVLLAADIPFDCEPNDTLIEYGQAASCSFATKGDIDIYRFTGESGQQAVIRASRTSGTGGSTCLELFAPDTTSIYTGCGNPVTLDAVLTHNGIYTLRSESALPSQTFNYILLLERKKTLSPSSIQVTYGETINNTFNFRGDIDFFSFQASAGDNLIIRSTRTNGTGGFPCIGLLGPDYVQIDLQCGNPITLEPVLSQTGTYSLFLESSDSRIFNYNLALQCIFGPCVPPSIPKKPEIKVINGFINFSVTNGASPDDADCVSQKDYGRAVIDERNDLFYFCTENGWIFK